MSGRARLTASTDGNEIKYDLKAAYQSAYKKFTDAFG